VGTPAQSDGGLWAGALLTRFVGYRTGTACPAFPTIVGGPGVYRAYECWARRARTIGRGSSDRLRHGELFQTTWTPSHDHIRGWLHQLPGPVAVTYEAGPTGFGLYRVLTAAGGPV
jgi:hypothetical protein